VEIIRVICTGKGSHRPIVMRSFNFGLLLNARLSADKSIHWGEGYHEWLDGHNPLMKSYTFTCRRCSPVRVTQVKRRTLRTALSGLQAAGETTLDISQLPF
jgi:hypothetical protein